MEVAENEVKINTKKKPIGWWGGETPDVNASAYRVGISLLGTLGGNSYRDQI